MPRCRRSPAGAGTHLPRRGHAAGGPPPWRAALRAAPPAAPPAARLPRRLHGAPPLPVARVAAGEQQQIGHQSAQASAHFVCIFACFDLVCRAVGNQLLWWSRSRMVACHGRDAAPTWPVDAVSSCRCSAAMRASCTTAAFLAAAPAARASSCACVMLASRSRSFCSRAANSSRSAVTCSRTAGVQFAVSAALLQDCSIAANVCDWRECVVTLLALMTRTQSHKTAGCFRAQRPI